MVARGGPGGTPIDLAPVPANLVQKTYKATGDLTLRGKTKSVTFDLTADAPTQDDVDAATGRIVRRSGD